MFNVKIVTQALHTCTAMHNYINKSNAGDSNTSTGSCSASVAIAVVIPAMFVVFIVLAFCILMYVILYIKFCVHYTGSRTFIMEDQKGINIKKLIMSMQLHTFSL